MKMFVNLYLFEVLATYLVRLPSVFLNARTGSRKDRLSQAQRVRQEGVVVSILMLFWFFAAIILPGIYAATDWFDRFDYNLPVWSGYAGLAMTGLVLWILWRAHTDLDRNWSAVVQIKENQHLVTQGIYSSIRHPIYSAHLLWGLTQVLMVPNWLAGVPGFAAIVLIMILRIPHEERMLIGQFGDEYRQYMQQTGALLPRFSNRGARKE